MKTTATVGLFGGDVSPEDVKKIELVIQALENFVAKHNLRPTIFMSGIVSFILHIATGDDTATRNFRRGLIVTFTRVIQVLEGMG